MFRSLASSESVLPAREMGHFLDCMPIKDFTPSHAGWVTSTQQGFYLVLLFKLRKFKFPLNLFLQLPAEFQPLVKLIFL